MIKEKIDKTLAAIRSVMERGSYWSVRDKVGMDNREHKMVRVAQVKMKMSGEVIAEKNKSGLLRERIRIKIEEIERVEVVY